MSFTLFAVLAPITLAIIAGGFAWWSVRDIKPGRSLASLSPDDVAMVVHQKKIREMAEAVARAQTVRERPSVNSLDAYRKPSTSHG